LAAVHSLDPQTMNLHQCQCSEKIISAVLVRHPNGTLIDHKCFHDPRVCPATGQRFDCGTSALIAAPGVTFKQVVTCQSIHALGEILTNVQVTTNAIATTRSMKQLAHACPPIDTRVPSEFFFAPWHRRHSQQWIDSLCQPPMQLRLWKHLLL